MQSCRSFRSLITEKFLKLGLMTKIEWVSLIIIKKYIHHQKKLLSKQTLKGIHKKGQILTRAFNIRSARS